MDKNIENEFYDLLGLEMSGDASPAEQARLKEIMNDNARLSSFYDHLKKAERPNPYSDEILQQSYASHYVKKKLLVTAPQSNKRRVRKLYSLNLRTYAAVAAMLALVAGVYYLLTMGNAELKPANNFKNEVATEKGSKSKIMLPDSTLVILNADSRLTYDHRFNTKTREVVLTGEAFFDVKHDSERPFIIHTGKADIKVLGTAFNVRNYPQEDLMETSLLRGRIELILDDKKGSRVILNPSEKIVISKSGLSKTVDNRPASHEEDIFKLTRIAIRDSAVAEIAWLSNKFSFVNKSLGEIAKELERQFNTAIVFRNEAVKHYRYTMHSDNYDLNEIMQILKLSQNFSYQFISKDSLIIE